MLGALRNIRLVALLVGGVLIFSIVSPLVMLFAKANATTMVDDLAKDGYTPLAEQAQHKIDEQLSLHSGWVGFLSWNSNNATILYLGPAELNPYSVKHIRLNHHMINASSNTGSGEAENNPLPDRPVNERDAILSDTTSGSTAEFEEDANYNLKASDDPLINFDTWLNAINSNHQYFLQVTPFYDERSVWGPTPAWRMDYDVVVESTCLDYSGYPSVSAPISAFNPSDPVKAYIRANTNTAGEYTMGVFDNLSLIGQSSSFTLPNDNGHNINLGHDQMNSFPNCGYASGAQVEEDSDGSGETWNFGSMSYTYGFYDTSTSSQTTSVNGFYGKEGYGATVLTVSGQGNQAATTYDYDPTIEIFANDQSGNALSGLAVSVYNSAHSLIQSGYTPMTVEVSSGGTYYIDYDNYGSNTITSMSNYPTVTSYSIASWGGEATLNVQSNSIVQVFGNYAIDSCPSSSSCAITVNSKDTSFHTINGLYMQLYQGNTNVANGWTTIQFTGVGDSNTYTVYANNYCNTSTHQQFTFSRWGDGTTSNSDTLSNLQHDTTITAYYTIGSC
jgi:hypothetical protein